LMQSCKPLAADEEAYLHRAAELYLEARPDCPLAVDGVMARMRENFAPDTSPYQFDAADSADKLPRRSGAPRRALRVSLCRLTKSRAQRRLSICG
jgi:hypothetical protein